METAMGWEMYPSGLSQLLVSVSQTYRPARVVVTESGSAWRDELTPDGEIQDKERTDYLEQHIDACAEAAAQGVPIDGYYVWSLLDNFEWSYGYDKRFGLVHVDYDSQRRTIKASGHRYANLIAQHRQVTAAS
jgi:beta-glucosidase